MISSEVIKEILMKKLDAVHVEVHDESALHAGHEQSQESGGDHFSVLVVSDQFQEKMPVQRHRMIYKALENELKGAIHALAINACTPEEWQANK